MSNPKLKNNSSSQLLNSEVNLSTSSVSSSSSANALLNTNKVRQYESYSNGSPAINKTNTSDLDLDLQSYGGSESESRPSRLVIILTLASSISGFMFGYDTGYISSALVQIGTDLSDKILTNGEKEFITSATSLGALIGAVISGILVNLIGRKTVLLGSNVVFVIGTIIQLASKTVWTMIAGRFVLGLGVGIASLIAPLMLSELAPAKYRGRLIVTNVMFITGCLLYTSRCV